MGYSDVTSTLRMPETPYYSNGVIDEEEEDRVVAAAVEKNDHRSLKYVAEDKEVNYVKESVAAVEDNDHRSLKQLMNGNGNGKSKEENRGRNSLGEHFTEEEKQQQQQQQQQLQLVKTQQHKSIKFKGMVSRYAKVLSHLIKVKRDPPRSLAPRKL